MKLSYLAVFGSLLSVASPAVAQRSGQGDPWARISQYDADGDGTVSKEEFTGPAQMLARFDTNQDGALTKEEVTAAMGQRGGKGKGKGKGSGGGKPDNAPKVGDSAPKVSAKRLGSNEVVDLSDPKRVTVLVFGSHT